MWMLKATDSRGSSLRGGLSIWWNSSADWGVARSVIIFSRSTGIDQSRSEAFQASAFPFS